MEDDCVFCRIVAGKIPATRVYEDDDVLAFMDIRPVTKGHTLVIPKMHFDPITRTPIPVLQKVIVAVRKIVQAQMDGLKADGVNVTQANGELAGQMIPHLHFHVIPRCASDSHSWNCPQNEYDCVADMQAFADSIRKAVRW